jgi:Predicted AAA-ATPase/PD-(D/E)XK nuclease superfamily
MGNENIKGIPYGVSDYGEIRKGNDYYVDKTRYLLEIEKNGRYLFFIRPRRFGKSLFLSMMHYYYDFYYADRFKELFKGTWIYDNPTQERNQYMVLSLNFSRVTPDPDKVEPTFLSYLEGTIVDFLRKYKRFLSSNEKYAYYSEEIEKGSASLEMLNHLITLCSSIDQNLYVIIDEYDNFANTILTVSGEQAYRDLTHGDGFFRSFFNVLKAGTGGVDAPIKKLFITGVSPITMDDVTSGFNIGKHVTLSSNLDQMLGFTEGDVKVMIDYYKEYSPILKTTSGILELLTQWYGNYLFSANNDVRLFNSDMVLYFIDYCLRENKLPENLIDRNVRIDYGKLRHLIIIDQDKNNLPTTNGNFSQIKQIIAEGGTLSRIADGFSLEEMKESHNFKSLLFYFGLLTIAGREGDLYRLQIPNETVKHLYYDYIGKAYKETGLFSLNLAEYDELMNRMAFKGAWRPLIEFVTGRMKESLALRDLITGEKAVQTFLNVYLGLSDLFIVHSEKEMNKGFADLLMEPYNAKYPEIKHSFLLELKYLKAGMKPGDAKVQQLVTEAEEQVKDYALDEKFSKTIGKTELIKLVLIFSGHEAVYIGEVTNS